MLYDVICKVTERFRFNIEVLLIPTISEKPVKSLGKVFDSNHNWAPS